MFKPIMCRWLLVSVLAGLLVVGLAAQTGKTEAAFGPNTLERCLGVELLADGTYLITDGGGARHQDDTDSKVLIVKRAGQILWNFAVGLRFAHSAIQLKNGNILIPDTNNNRLIEVNRAKKLVWTSESWKGGQMSDGTRLDYPNHVQEMPDGSFLVSDRDHSRIIEINRAGLISWQFDQLNHQHAPIFIGDGTYLVSDSDNNRVLEFDQSGAVTWFYAQGLKWPRSVEKLDNGNYLITDSNNNRVIELSPAKRLVAQFSGLLATPYEAHRLANGNTLVCDAQHGRLVELAPDGKLVWEFHNLVYPDYPSVPVDGGMETVKAKVDLKAGIEQRGMEGPGWFVSDMVGHGSGSWSVDTAVFRSGKASLRIDSLSADKNRRSWVQRISVKPGEKLNLFVGIKCQTSGASAAGYSVTWYDAMGGTLSGVNSSSVNGNSDWMTVPLSCVAPANAAMADLALVLVGPGTAWFDNLEFGTE